MFAHLLIFLGAGTGGLLRYWLGGLLQSWWGPSFPLGTLAVNVTGCLVMGFLGAVWSDPAAIRAEYRAAVLVGLLGGYTTFSTFGRETLALAHDGAWTSTGLYVVGSVGLSLVAIWLGFAAGHRIFGVNTP